MLSKRLSSIADYIEKGSRLADIGTDHGYLPIYLAENNICEYIFASDIRQGPLSTAIKDARLAGVFDKITFCLAPGLEGCDRNSVDTIVIAGMGGETMIDILSASPWALEKKLILQPQSKTTLLREWLNNNNCIIKKAGLVEDMGRIYLIWQIEKGEKQQLSPGQLYIDDKIRRDKLLHLYLNTIIKNLLTRIQGLEKASVCENEELSFNKSAYEELCKIRREIENA